MQGGLNAFFLQLESTYEMSFCLSAGQYELVFQALNSISRVETRQDVRVMHPVQLLDVRVLSPLVHAHCSLSIILQGQVQVAFHAQQLKFIRSFRPLGR